MTKTLHVTNLKEIHHIKVSCGKCGFSVIFPPDSGYKLVYNTHIKKPYQPPTRRLRSSLFYQ